MVLSVTSPKAASRPGSPRAAPPSAELEVTVPAAQPPAKAKAPPPMRHALSMKVMKAAPKLSMKKGMKAMKAMKAAPTTGKKGKKKVGVKVVDDDDEDEESEEEDVFEKVAEVETEGEGGEDDAPLSSLVSSSAYVYFVIFCLE